MVSNQQPIAFSSVIFLFARGENSVGICCRRSTSITEYASKRNSTFCLPFAFCLRRKLKNSAPKPGKAIKLRCQLGWLVEGSQGSWLVVEGRGMRYSYKLCQSYDQGKANTLRPPSFPTPIGFDPAASMKYLCHSQQKPKIEIKIASAASRAMPKGGWAKDSGQGGGQGHGGGSSLVATGCAQSACKLADQLPMTMRTAATTQQHGNGATAT